MRKSMKALAEGKFEYIPLELIISVSRIEEMIDRNEILVGSFCIESVDSRKVEGVIYSTDARMKCSKTQFCGTKIEIEYEFDSVGMDSSDTNIGEIYIESNAGEYVVPYVVTVEVAYAEMSTGRIKNLFHFTNLARNDFREACRLFRTQDFSGVLMDDEQRRYFDCLGEEHASFGNMEEFLVSVHKKDRAAFLLQEHQLQYASQGETFQKTVLLEKTGWGDLSIDVKCGELFIQTEKNKIRSEDFIGNNYLFEFIINERRLHTGRNIGQIVFLNVYQKEVLEIEVTVPHTNRVFHVCRRKLIELCRLYLDVRDLAISKSVWARRSQKCVEELIELDSGNEFYRLFLAQLLFMQKKPEEAQALLNEFQLHKGRLKKQKPQLYAYFRYVTAIGESNPEQTQEVMKEIHSLSENHRENFSLMQIRLFMDEHLDSSPIIKYEMLREQFEHGCRSPFLYMEAYLLLMKEQVMLTRLDNFEVRTLNFALRQAILDKNIADRAVDLSLQQTGFSMLVYKLVSSIYYLFELDACIESICAMLIRGRRSDRRYFVWFERGVRQNIKLTQLFEYYMYALPAEYDDMLPRTLLIYFSYDNVLDNMKKATLYANVCRNSGQIPDLLQVYEPQIEMFVEEQLEKRHISDDLNYLYYRYADLLMQKEKTAEALSDIVFSDKLLCSNPDIVRVIVRYPQLSREFVYPVSGQRAWIKRYFVGETILLEDINGVRHVTTIPYEEKRQFDERRLSEITGGLDNGNIGILLRDYQKTGVVLRDSNYMVCERLLDCSELSSSFRQEVIKKLVYFYQEHERKDELEHVLNELDFELTEKYERAAYIEFMIRNGQDEDAYEKILIYGPEKIRGKSLVKLCSRRIRMDVEEKELLRLCMFLFMDGKYDETILEYLAKYYYGTINRMVRIWKETVKFHITSYDLCERILVSMLFTGYLTADSNELFEQYYRNEPNRTVVLAYLSYYSYQYVVNEQLVNRQLFGWVLKEYENNEEICDACLLALLKYYSEEDFVSEEMVSILQDILESFLGRRICLAFFKKLDEKVTGPYRITDKTIIEYRANPQTKVFLHYRLIRDGDDDKPYITVPMKPAFGTIFVKELTAFYEEKVQYYISEITDAAQDGMITRSAMEDNQFVIGCETDGRYEMINEMFVSYCMKDETTLTELMKEYATKDAVAEKLFEIM